MRSWRSPEEGIISDTPPPQLGITIDCRDARAQAEFWCTALGYAISPPPTGWSTWAAFLTDHGVPEDEWGDGATIGPASGSGPPAGLPAGLPGGPSISFLRVPETKTVKNRVHLDVRVSGGRHVDQPTRLSRIRAKETELHAVGATTVTAHGEDHLDHLVMRDPEGNEFCVV